MPQDIDTLTLKLQQFNYTLQYIKKTQDQQNCKVIIPNINIVLYIITEQQNSTKLDNSYQKIDLLSKEIQEKFKKGNFKNQQKFLLQKLQKDFARKMDLYKKLLKSRQARKSQELKILRQSLRAHRQTISKKKNKDSSDDQSQNNHQQIQMQEVNQQTLFQEHMIELKQKQLLEVKDKMETAFKVQKEVNRLVNQQGQQLDIAESNIDSAKENVKQAQQYLQEGKKHHISANKKKFCIGGIILVLLLVIIIPILVKFL